MFDDGARADVGTADVASDYIARWHAASLNRNGARSTQERSVCDAETVGPACRWHWRTRRRDGELRIVDSLKRNVLLLYCIVRDDLLVLTLCQCN